MLTESFFKCWYPLYDFYMVNGSCIGTCLLHGENVLAENSIVFFGQDMHGLAHGRVFHFGSVLAFGPLDHGIYLNFALL